MLSVLGILETDKEVELCILIDMGLKSSAFVDEGTAVNRVTQANLSNWHMKKDPPGNIFFRGPGLVSTCFFLL